MTKDYYNKVVAIFSVLIILLLLFGCSGNNESSWSYEEMEVEATAYCPCEKCCGEFADGWTATMRNANTKGVAVDPRMIPLGSYLDIPGYDTWALADEQHCAWLPSLFGGMRRQFLSWGLQLGYVCIQAGQHQLGYRPDERAPDLCQ